MDSIMLTRKLYRCEVFTEAFKIMGKLEPTGEILTALGDRQRTCIPVHDAEIVPVPAQSPLGPLAVPELIINKDNVTMVALLDAADYDDIRLQTSVTVLTAYTPAFAIQAEFHLGGELRVRDFIDGLAYDFVPVTNAKLFPLISSRMKLTDSLPFVILNTNAITMYHE